MKRLISVLLILMMLIPAACADNMEETIESYNHNAEFTGVPKVTQMLTDGTFLCMETGILLMFIKSETSDDIDLISCVTYGRPDPEGFLLTACTLMNMADSINSVHNYGILMNHYIAAKNTNGSMIIRTGNGRTGKITYKPEQYTFYIELQ